MESDARALEVTVKSLPLYVVSDGQKASAAPNVSRMIAVQENDGLASAIVMTQELVHAVTTATRAGLEAIYQTDLANQKKDVIMEFQMWAENERNELLAGSRTSDHASSDRQRLAKLDEDLELVEQQKLAIDEPARAADEEASSANLNLLGLLQDVFEGAGLVDSQNERFDTLAPDDAFLDRWKIPHLDIQPEKSGEDAIEPGGRSNSGWNSEDEFPDEEPSPAEIARRDFYAAAEDLNKAQNDFEKRHEVTQQPSYLGMHAEPKHPFESFKQLNQNQVLAEERFRRARHRCNELGVDVLYDAQSSSFAQDAEGEQRARATLANFAGPGKYPQVQKWLDGVADEVVDEGSKDQSLTPSTATSAWDGCPWVDYDDSWSAVAPGAGKSRIQRAQTARDALRAEAKEQWAKTMGVSKDDWDAHHWG
ncbi:hypothetical protein M409DRAFT_30857 [Zasmidium cellare ATCC 36951]|uniref:Uncharacterized protein n=1 Tax=Zasmidium cellare ATCC 36951 TaxID=1080233 RepID=A0A6A6BYJ2_ZASCE|nr:uncharacterized protein M409DRAFT_30857 [Zasmidium cellare ATCC 36951]KAF2158632.1 hypothetical protein M409DRAFT_30857 [Zasmidium cellare ATCC 36951]